MNAPLQLRKLLEWGEKRKKIPPSKFIYFYRTDPTKLYFPYLSLWRGTVRSSLVVPSVFFSNKVWMSGTVGGRCPCKVTGRVLFLRGRGEGKQRSSIFASYFNSLCYLSQIFKYFRQLFEVFGNICVSWRSDSRLFNKGKVLGGI